MKPTITVLKTSDIKKLLGRLQNLGKKAAYVGIPATTALDRQRELISMAQGLVNQSSTNKSGKPGKRRQAKINRINKSILSEVNNAQLLYIHTKGSPARNIPARPVLEPAISASGNREAISFELSKATQASLEGKPTEVMRRLKRAGMAASNASKAWFTDSRNGWPPNAPATIKAKGSDRPLIDTGALRASITYLVKDDE